MDLDRRAFLKTAGRVALSVSVINTSARRAAAGEERPSADDAMGVLVDLTKCNGCRQCEAACQEAAGFEVPTKEELLDESVFVERRPLAPRSYTMVNRFRGRGEEAEAVAVYVKSNCLHCLNPACVSACLVGALRRQPNGAVTYDAWKCMGCRYCMVACPFEIPTYEYDNVLRPQVRKCTFCSNEGNPYKGSTPACVAVCPKQCLIYGRRGELLSRARSRIKRYPHRYIEHVYGEHEAGGTSWLYLSATPFDEIGFLHIAPEAPSQLSEAIQHGVFNHFVPPVAWAAALGIAMWMSRPESSRDKPCPAPASEDDLLPTGRSTGSECASEG
jgi:formate dehydrogenase iron-sulfur subunit